MGQHEGKLLDLVRYIENTFDSGKDVNGAKLLKIYEGGGCEKYNWGSLYADYIGMIDGKHVIVDVVGYDEWRQMIGKVVAYLYEGSKRWTDGFEVWLVTDFSAPCYKIDENNKEEYMAEYTAWFRRIVDLVRKVSGINAVIRFKYLRDGKDLIDL